MSGILQGLPCFAPALHYDHQSTSNLLAHNESACLRSRSISIANIDLPIDVHIASRNIRDDGRTNVTANYSTQQQRMLRLLLCSASLVIINENCVKPFLFTAFYVNVRFCGRIALVHTAASDCILIRPLCRRKINDTNLNGHSLVT
jgi:hypothetical protein